MVFLYKNRGADGGRKPVAGARAAGRGVFGAALLTAALLAFGMGPTASVAGAASSLSITSPVDRSLITESTFPLTFSVSGVVAPKVVCLVDGRIAEQPVYCNPEAGLARLPNGFHRIKLIAYDTGGTKVVAYRTVSFTVDDALAPQLTSSLTDGAVIDGSDVPFLFTSLGGAVYECRVNGGGSQACGPDAPAVDPELGTFLPRSLPNGPATIAFESMDVNGRTGGLNKSVTVDDTTPPGLSVASPIDGATITESPFRASFSNSGEYAQILCRIDSGPSIECAGEDHRIGVGSTQLLPLVNGSHVLQLIAVDLSGNVTSITRSFTVDDTTAPAASILSPTDSDVYYDEATYDLAASHSPGLVECRFRPAAFVNCGDARGLGGVSDANSADHRHPGSNGDYHVLDVRLTDPMGRQATDTVTFGIDDTTPKDAFFVTPTTEPVTRWFPIILSEYGDRARCTFNIDGGPFTGCDDGRGLAIVEIAVPGDHLIAIRVVDGVGNIQTLYHRVRIEGRVEAAKAAPPPVLAATLTLNRARATSVGRHVFLPLAGRLIPRGAATVAQVCKGFVRINVRMAPRHYLVRRPKLRRKGSSCVYSVRARVRTRVIASNRTVTAVAKTRTFGTALVAKRRIAVPQTTR